MSVSIEDPTSERSASLRTKWSWRWVLVPVALISLASAFFIGYQSHRQQDGLKVFGHVKTFGEARALFPRQLAYFLGQRRDSDGTLYGEWVRARFVQRCRGLDPKKVEFTALMQGPFNNDAFRWDIEAEYRGSLPRSCDVHRLLVTIGGWWSTTGEILALSPTTNIGMATFGVVEESGKGNLAAGNSDSDDSWWTRFLAGDAP